MQKHLCGEDTGVIRKPQTELPSSPLGPRELHLVFIKPRIPAVFICIRIAGLLICVCFDDSAVEMAFTQTSPTQQMSTLGICLFLGQNSQYTVGEVERRHLK